MKITLTVDQTASLIAGLDAPNSTMVLDIPAADIPGDDRALIMPQYDIASGQFRGNPDDTDGRRAAGWPTLPDCRVPAVLANCDAAGAIAALSAYADALRARAAALVTATAEYEAAQAVRRQEAEAKAVADAAALADERAGIIAGTVAITSVNRDSVACYVSGRHHVIADDIEPMVAAFLAAETARKEAAAAAAAEAEAARKARQIAGRDVIVWQVSDGCISQVSAPGIPYDSHRLAKNWIATVKHGGPAKLDRDFWDGNASARIIPAGLKPGDYLEGAEKDKKGRSTKVYFRVLEITEKALTVREAGAPKADPPAIEPEIAKLAKIRALDAVPA